MTTFKELNLNNNLIAGLKKQNITEPTKVQSLTINKILDKMCIRDSICTPVPSRPAEPPNKCVINVPKNTKGAILNGTFPLPSLILSIIKLFPFDESFPYLKYK